MNFKNNSGITFLEIIISLFFIFVIILAFSTTAMNIKLNQKVRLKNQALALAAEQIEILRKKTFSQLTNRANADFFDVAYNFGLWQVKTGATAPSQTKAYNVSPLSTTNEITGLALLPQGQESNFTLETKIKPLALPSGSALGLAFRYHDINNYYRWVLSSTSIKFEKKSNGALSTLWSQAGTFNLNSWQTLKVIATGQNFDLYLNGNKLTTVADADFNDGLFGLLALTRAEGNFDDVSFITSQTKSWNFDSDTAGNVASGWERFGLNDLSLGAGTLTIENYNGNSNIKKITVTVSWTENGRPLSLRLLTLIGQYGIHPQ